MSTSSLMTLGTRAMFAAYAQLQTASHNISNANVDGYSRQRVLLATTEGQYTGSGYFGRGVTVQSVTRATNMFLTQQAVSTASTAASDSAHLGMLQQLERVFGTGTAGLGNAATQLFNAFSDLASAPADVPARQAVLARAGDFASLARSTSDQIEALQANLTQDVQNAVSEVNSLAEQVARLNLQIADAGAAGQPPNDLMDQRDELVRRIADKVDVSTITGPDGSTNLFVAGGQSLVLRGAANQLVAGPSEFDPSRVTVSISVAGKVTGLDSDVLQGGQIHGLLQFQDIDLVEARNRLGQMVGALATRLNTQQSLGLDLNGNAGTALFTLGGPAVLPAQANARNAAGQLIAQVSLTVADPSALKASEYELKADPANAGQYTATRLADGQVIAGLVDGSTVDGFTLHLGSPAPGAGDRFLLQPVAKMAPAIAQALKQPRAIAAANPLTATAVAGNTGSATVGRLAIVAPPASGWQPVTLQFTNGSGAWQVVDASSNVLASGVWSAGSPIAYNGFQLSLNGAPAAGDRIAIAPTAYPASNNGNALVMDGLAEQGLVDGATLTDAYASTLADVGVRVQGSLASRDTSSTVASRAHEALTNETGVNVDEEAASLIQYQQNYQAAARILQTAQQVLDQLLQLGK